LDDLEADELERVVLALLRRRKRLARHLEQGPARDRPVEPDHRPAARAAAGDDNLCLLAGGEQVNTPGEPPRVAGRRLDEDAAAAPVRPSALSPHAPSRPGQPSISTSTRRPSRWELARTTVRSARPMRPPRPITLPTSSGDTCRWRTSAPS